MTVDVSRIRLREYRPCTSPGYTGGSMKKYTSSSLRRTSEYREPAPTSALSSQTVRERRSERNNVHSSDMADFFFSVLSPDGSPLLAGH